VTAGIDPGGDRWEIRQLVERYAQAADQSDGAAVAALFAEDGELSIWLVPNADRPTRRRQGHVAIAKAIDGLASYRATHHTIASSVVSIAGDSAAGETRCVAHHIEAETAADGTVVDRVLYLCYVETFARIEARWRFTAREVHVQWASVQPVESI
jgi:ketosteroid isomerase-like protein